MQFFDTFLTCYGWEGIALAGAVLAMFGVQLYYYIFVYGRIPGYKNNRRPAVLEADPQVSVVIPLFSEDYSFVEERLPLILAQNCPEFEVVLVYVGHDSAFYEEIVRLYLEPYFGTVALTDVRPVDVQTFAAKHKKLSESHLKKIRLCLVDIFETAIENDLCYKNPAKRVQFSSSAHKRVKRVLTEKQIAIVREEALEAFPAAALLLDTGMRRGELLGTMWTDFVLEPGNGSLHIQRTVVSEVGVLKLAAPKKNSFRTIPISDECIALVQSLPHDSLYLFPSQTGGLQDTDHFSQRLKKFMTGVHERHPDIPVLTSHEMRHTYGTSLRRNGVDIYTIQKILGHKDIQVTAEIYVHNELEELRAAVFHKTRGSDRKETMS